MSLGAAGLAAALIALDTVTQRGQWGWLEGLYLTEPAGARAVLATVAGSAITVAGVIFSITIVALSLASSQYGPRLLPNFMRAGGTQFVLGAYIGVFIYCLLVLTVVRAEPERQFVPQLSLAAGVLLGILAFGVLIYFIHHVAVFIQVPRILDDVAGELEHTFQRLFPARDDGPEPTAAPDEETGRLPDDFATTAVAVDADRTGYVQTIDHDRLLHLATEHDLVIQALLRSGQFVFRGNPLARARGLEEAPDEVPHELRGAFGIGPQRTSIQDAEYAIDQLVEVALRALSPGINDPFTAINCLDRLGAELAALADRRLPSAILKDDDGRTRVVAEPPTYRSIVDAAFNQLRQHARANTAVIIRLLEVIEHIAKRDLATAYREALARQLELAYHESREVLPVQADRADLDARYRAARIALGFEERDETA